jgi:DNA ligase-1
MTTTIKDLADGEETTMQGSGKKPYVLKNVGGTYSCSCPAWRNQSLSIDVRSCKHLRKLRGDAAETARTGSPGKAKKKTKAKKKLAAKRVEEHGFLLADDWDEDGDVNPKGKLQSEKFDGVRAKWIAKLRIFISRAGNQFFAPEWFTKDLPNEDLDGELFMGRGLFEKTSGIVRRKNGGEAWRKIKYHVFDVPNMNAAFDARIALVHVLIKDKTYAVAVKHKVCRSKKKLLEELDALVEAGGEGFMLRDKTAHYEGFRSSTLLKVKKWYDAEAVVIGHQPGKGRNKGRMGALVCVMEDGKEFEIGTGFTDAVRRNPPAVGVTITYKYRELTQRGVPRHSSYLRVREV